MSVLDDILKGISPVMGAYREMAQEELTKLRTQAKQLEPLVEDLAECRELIKQSMSEYRDPAHIHPDPASLMDRTRQTLTAARATLKPEMSNESE